MSQTNNIFSIRLVKTKNKLIHKSSIEFEMYKEFINSLEEGQEVEVFFEANKDDGTKAQLAKIHACLKQIAVDTGNSVDDLKLVIKEKTGLAYTDKDGKGYVKSFAHCSKEELALVIEEIKVIGWEMCNFTF